MFVPVQIRSAALLAHLRLAGAAAISEFWPLYFCILQSEFYGSNLSLTDSVTPPVITPPPTPVNRFLASVSSSKRNQIHVCIPRYILRGLGRDSYHVFEVKVKHFFALFFFFVVVVVFTPILRPWHSQSHYRHLTVLIVKWLKCMRNRTPI